MPHWKKLMDPKDMLFAYDLDGRDVTITIEKVTGGELTGEQGRKTKKPIAHIAGKTKKLALNNTNCQTIEQLTGTNDYEQWKNVRVTLFPTTTNFGGKTVECIRIRPYHPKGTKEEADRQAREDAKRAEARKYYRRPGDEQELDEQEIRWLTAAGRPPTTPSMGPTEEEVELINAAARAEGLIDG